MRVLLFLFSIFLCLNCNAHKKHLKIITTINGKHLPTVGVVVTGGTIVEKTDASGASVPSSDAGKSLVKAIPQLKKVANIKLVEFSNIDSSHMSPQIWANLSRTVDQLIDEHPELKGVIVVHGTDTMAEGAYFLDITLKTRKPVVFIGAMKNSSDPFTDGPENFLNGVFQICSNKSKNWGVTVTMNQYINSARDVKKTQTTNVQTFDSGEKGYLGYIYNGKINQFNERVHGKRFKLKKKLAKVSLFTDYAGANGSFIKLAADKGYDGIVVEALGSGNVNAAVAESIKYAISKGIVVVISTRVYQGAVYPAYGDKGGGRDLKNMGAIVTGDLRGPKARLLLMVTIPIHGKHSKKLESFFANTN
jgi:L-asparaginase